jgi:cytoskeletal protein RodZ
MKVFDPSAKSSIVDTPIRKFNMKEKESSSNKKSMTFIIVFFTILLLAVSGLAIFLFIQNNQLKSNPTQALDEQSKEIKTNVGKLILLDSTEDISVATISDAEKLKQDNPEFYKNAANGQYILVSSKRAILYDKSRNIIINVAPIINPQTDSTSKTTAPTQTATSTPTPTTTEIVKTTTVKR